MRIIDADMLKKAIEQDQIQWNRNTENDIGRWEQCERVLCFIDNTPTLTNKDVEKEFPFFFKRPQGEWIEQHYTSCGKILRWRADVIEQKCSQCGRYTLIWANTMPSEFCSNCGAEMRKGDKEE